MADVGSTRPALTFVKLGGSLITDKTGKEAVRQDVLRRLASELAAALGQTDGRLVVGHGSGSFGHLAAVEHGFVGRRGADLPVSAISAVQDAAARLHRRVVGALIDAGVSPFSIVPGSAFVAQEGKADDVCLEPLDRALEEGLVPVLYGDVVLDSRQRAVILSTETLFAVAIAYLRRVGWPVRRVVWLGQTEGILDEEGRLVQEVRPDLAAAVERLVGRSQGTDVTGGMSHRLEAALDLARLGVESVIADGRVPGLLERAVAGRPVRGTIVVVDRDGT